MVPRRSLIAVSCVLVLAFAGSALSQQAADQDPPLDVGASERTTVRLVLVDVVVVDAQGRTVPDLKLENFEVTALGEPVDVDTLDIDCPIGAVDDPRAMALNAKRPALQATERPRRIVMAFDYLHLNPLEREESLRQAKALLQNGTSEGDEVMLVALNGGLRIEQPFTADADIVFKGLRRMQYDITLWNGYFTHLNEFGFVDGLGALFDVLGTVSGPKAVVLYSAMSDVPLETQFERLAAVASVSRCALYPVDLRGLVPPDMGVAELPGGG